MTSKEALNKSEKYKKSVLKYGNVVELRNGFKLLLLKIDKKLVDLTGAVCSSIDYYNENLTSISCNKDYDIIKVYKDYTCKELLWERKYEPKPKPKLTEDEKVILRNLPEEYKWIARDENGFIYLYKYNTFKCLSSWATNGEVALFPFRNLFQFIEWEDEEPYLIEDLLG